MTNLRIDSAIITNMTNSVETFEVEQINQDVPGSRYSVEWAKWYGHYQTIPDVRSVIDTMASWIVGKGYKCKNKSDEEKLKKLKGNGKDTANTIFENQLKVMFIGGDSFAEIVEDKSSRLTNLKPMNPGNVVINSTNKGIIENYEQKNFPTLPPFPPKKIFHLSWGRLGDECHGHAFAEALQEIIKMKGESMKDLQIVFHRYVKPLIIAEADTDDDAELLSLKIKLDNTVKLGENMVVPKGSLATERISIPQYSTLDPLPWIKYLDDYFTLMSRVPEVIRGSGKETTEASSRVLYVSFQQMIEWGQLYLEEQIEAQLGIEIEFEFPVSLDPAVKESISKERKLSNTSPRGDNLK
jgi:hypothetical protein